MRGHLDAALASMSKHSPDSPAPHGATAHRLFAHHCILTVRVEGSAALGVDAGERGRHHPLAVIANDDLHLVGIGTFGHIDMRLRAEGEVAQIGVAGVEDLVSWPSVFRACGGLAATLVRADALGVERSSVAMAASLRFGIEARVVGPLSLRAEVETMWTFWQQAGPRLQGLVSGASSVAAVWSFE